MKTIIQGIHHTDTARYSLEFWLFEDYPRETAVFLPADFHDMLFMDHLGEETYYILRHLFLRCRYTATNDFLFLEFQLPFSPETKMPSNFLARSLCFPINSTVEVITNG